MLSLKARATLSAGLLFALAGLNPALADVPGALDRIPTSAGMIVAFSDIEQVRSRVEDMAKVMKADFDKDENGPLAMAKKLLAVDGLDKHGSMAVAVMAGEDGKVSFQDKEGPMVIVVPVKDYDAFAHAMGATETKGTASLKVDGKPIFAKDLGGGYAAMGPQKDLIDSFAGKAGNLEAHKKSLGKAGMGIAERADILFISNIGVIKPQLQDRVAGMKDQLKGMGAMAPQGGEQVQAMADAMSNISTAFVRDAKTGIIGLGLGEGGVTLDFGAQFNDDTPSAKLLSQPGKASGLLGHVPAQPFLFAFAMDMTSPAIKQAIKDLSAAGMKAADKGDKAEKGDKPEKKDSTPSSFAAIIKGIDKIDGMAAVVGASAAPLMGLLANTCQFVATSDPKGYLEMSRAATTEMSGKSINGVKTTVDYKKEATEVGGVKVDTWTAQIETDPNDPNAASAQMAMPMIFGPAGPGGMIAAVPNGVVSTMSQNTPLFTLALDAAKGEKSLANDEAIKDVQKQLPENRMIEAYLGSKAILDAANGLMGMMGAGGDIKVPAKLSPIGIGAGASSGGVDLRFFVPTDVIKTVAAAAESMKGEGAGGDAAPAEKPKAPRF